jgi:hypothetical protein
MDLSWARGYGFRTLGSGQGLQGRYGSGGLAVPGSARLGFGDAAEADFETEGAPSRPGHDQRAVKARVTLPDTRRGTQGQHESLLLSRQPWAWSG